MPRRLPRLRREWDAYERSLEREREAADPDALRRRRLRRLAVAVVTILAIGTVVLFGMSGD